MRTETHSLDTSDSHFVDVTDLVSKFCADEGGDGLVNVFAPHATAGIALMETGSNSEDDLEDVLNRLLPRDHRYRHSHGSPGHGADHLLPAFVAPSVVIPVTNGAPALGTWQSIVLVDLNRDNPHRNLRLSFLSA
jgi:secondary thiamine-phosphate synthase enzyme